MNMQKEVFLKMAGSHALRGYQDASQRQGPFGLVVDALLEKRWLSRGGPGKRDETFASLGGFLSANELSRATPGEDAPTGGGPYDEGPNPARVIPFYADAPYGLEDLLEAICPDIRYLQFRAIEKRYVRDTVDIAEFYGDRIFLATQFLSFEALWEVLVAKGLVKDEAP
jgi:hypothetical protein